LSEVETACARAIIVSRGRVVADGALDEIRAKSGKVRYVVSVQESTGDQPYRGSGPMPKQSDVYEALRAIRGIDKLAELPTDERSHTFEIGSEQDIDLRPEIFRMIADKGWVLLELHRDTQTLEDVFRDLTVGEARRNRRIGAAPAGADEDDDDDSDDSEDAGDEDAGEEKAAQAN
jgi:ABC-2 type transport system ATP-binding protein